VAAPTFRELARHRLEHYERFDPEAWAKEVEEARTRGCRLVRIPGMTIEIRDYSLELLAAS
jgi:hypothetical protein